MSMTYCFACDRYIDTDEVECEEYKGDLWCWECIQRDKEEQQLKSTDKQSYRGERMSELKPEHELMELISEESGSWSLEFATTKDIYEASKKYWQTRALDKEQAWETWVSRLNWWKICPIIFYCLWIFCHSYSAVIFGIFFFVANCLAGIMGENSRMFKRDMNVMDAIYLGWCIVGRWFLHDTEEITND